MGNQACSLGTFISSQNFYTSVASCENALDTNLQQSSNIALIAAPLLLIQIANFTFEAQSAIRLSESLTTGKLLTGITRTLRPYRQQVNSISLKLNGTPAANCASVITLPYLYDTTSENIGTVRQVPLNDSGRIIADIYAASVQKCTQEPIVRLRAKMDQLSQLKPILQSQYLDKAQAAIENCTSLVFVDQELACYIKFIDDFKTVLSNFSKILNQSDASGDVFALGYSDQDLSFVSNCLLNANIDAAIAGNTILYDIRNCAAAAGVNITITEASVLAATQVLTVLYPDLSKFYGEPKLNAAAQLQETFLKFLSSERTKAEEEGKVFADVDAFIKQSQPLQRALKIAQTNTTDPSIKQCLLDAYNVVKTNITTELKDNKACSDNYKADIVQLQTSLSESFAALRPDPPRSNPQKTNPLCVPEGCFYPYVTTDAADVAYQNAVSDIISRYRQNTNVGSCRLTVEVYGPLTKCNASVPIVNFSTGDTA